MPVTPPPFDAATVDKLTQAKIAVDSWFLAGETLNVWKKIQTEILLAAKAAKKILELGKDPAVAADNLIEFGESLEARLANYTSAKNKAAADAAMVAQVGGMTQERVDAAVVHLQHAIAEMKNTPKDGSEADSLADMLLTYYTAPATI